MAEALAELATQDGSGEGEKRVVLKRHLNRE